MPVIEDEARWNAIAQTPVCRRWWTHMKELMPANLDDSPKSTALTEVFGAPRYIVTPLEREKRL